MIRRLQELTYSDEDLKWIKERSRDMIKEWNGIQMFIMWEYSNSHFNITDEYCYHCFFFSLGGQCTHTHNKLSCSKFMKEFSFLDSIVRMFLTDSMTRVQNE